MTMLFLTTLRALDAKATPAPWAPYCSDSGEYGLVYEKRAGTIRPVADFPGSGQPGGEASDANCDLTELLRNHAARLAALVEAVDAMIRDGDLDSEYPNDIAVLAARAALEAP